jgi:peptide/nickel transport system permease protein
MPETARRTASLRAGLATLGTLLLAALAGPPLLGGDPERALDPAVTALAPPGARFETLRLAAGYDLAGSRVTRTDGEYLIEGPRGERAVAATRVDPRRPVAGVRFWLGTDALGRDVALRALYGGRVSLAVAFFAVALSLLCGVPAGLIAGLARRPLDGPLLGTIEAAQAFPRLFLLVALVAIVPPGVGTTVAILGFTGWMPVARLVRSETRRLRDSEFALAARAAGVSRVRLALRHLLPNMAAPVAIEASLGMGAAVTSEAALSFLGLGVPAPLPSWGNLIADGRALAASAWWVALVPGLALVATVIACGLVGDALRDRFDPRSTPLGG